MSELFSPFQIGGVSLKNRVMISPMCQYAAHDGLAGCYHLAHYGRFALGGAGLVMVEATAVTPEGMGTAGDLGLWNDAQRDRLAKVAECVAALGAVPGIQICHTGRKGAAQRPWHGGGPLSDVDLRERGEAPWPLVAPSAIPMSAGRALPQALDLEGIATIRDAFVAAARRAVEAGFRVIEIHSAHGYLLNQFVSPVSNQRDDAYGGSLEGRCRLSCEIVAAIKAELPQDRALFVRISAADGVDGGHELPDSIEFARLLRQAGADLIDCSSGGLTGPASGSRLAIGLGYQVPYADAIRREVGIPTAAVGLILDGPQAEAVLTDGKADLVAVGRAALDDPNWPLHAQQALDGPGHAHWPPESGWWLDKRAAQLRAIAAAGR